MKKLRDLSVMVLAGMFLCLMGIGAKPALAQEYTFRAGHTFDPSNPTAKAIAHYAELVEKESKGRIKITIHPAGSLGDFAELYDQQKMGALELSYFGFPTGSRDNRRLSFDDLPYLWPDVDTAIKALNGDLGKIVTPIMYQLGLKMLNYTEPLGFRHFTNNVRPIHKPDDLKGLKIRIYPSELRLEAFKAMGISPTPMPFGEVYTALKLKTIDGQENPLSIINSQKFYEVQKYLSLTRHLLTNGGLAFSRPLWEKLPKDVQDLLQKCATMSEEYDIRVFKESEAQALGQLKEKGIQVNEVNFADFKNLVKPVYKKWAPVLGPEIVEVLKKVTGSEF